MASDNIEKKRIDLESCTLCEFENYSNEIDVAYGGWVDLPADETLDTVKNKKLSVLLNWPNGIDAPQPPASMKKKIAVVISGSIATICGHQWFICHESLVIASTGTPKRGRPRKIKDEEAPEKLIDKIMSACSNNLGQPTVYASTTKGGMKLIYDGHHFNYSFRKGQFSIFQCCYKENKEQCKVRVVSNQKRVFHLDGEHVHFIQATDKSVTSIMFETGENYEDLSKITSESEQQQSNVASGDVMALQEHEEVAPEEIYEPHFLSNEPYPTNVNVQDIDLHSDLDANDFREKIKKRLQKALLGKKK